MGNQLAFFTNLDTSLEFKDGFECHGLKYPPSYKSDEKTKKRKGKELKKSRHIIPPGLNDNTWLEYNYPIDNVVLSGGGSKGYAFVGALKALEDCGILQKLKRIGGSSVGSICAGLLAVGCSPQEIADVFSPNVKWLFQDQECMPITCIPNIWKKFGINPASRFYKIYGAHIAARFGTPDLTFGQLYEKTGRELCIVVTNLTKMCSEYCHPKTTPDVPIRLAVRMSMSFPVVFQPIQYNFNGIESWCTDGGTLDNYPVHIFDNPLLDMNHNTSPEEESETLINATSNSCSSSCPSSPESSVNVNIKTLGMYVVSENPTEQYIWKTLFGSNIPYRPTYVPNTKLAKQRLKDDHPKRRKQKAKLMRRVKNRNCYDTTKMTMSIESLASVAGWPLECVAEAENCKIKHFGDFVIRTVEMLLVHQRQLKIKPSDVHRTIPINCGYIGTNDYDIETGDREFMVRQGYECTKRYLIEFIQKMNEKEEQMVNQNQETMTAIIDQNNDATELQVIAQVPIQNSNSSESGFSEMENTNENKECNEVVKVEITTTETTHIVYTCIDSDNKQTLREPSLSHNGKVINGHLRHYDRNISKETEV